MTIAEGTEAWLQARAGIVTCSALDAVMSNGKGGAPSKPWEKLLAVKTWEVLAGTTAQIQTGFAADRGIALEPVALQAYATATRQKVTKPGFILHPAIERFGGTPDGITESRVCVQVKCPIDQAKIIQLRIHGDIDRDYYAQIQGELAVTGYQMAHLVVFDDRLPPEHQLTVIHVPRDAAFIAEMENRVQKFLVELDQNVRRAKGEIL